MPASKNVARGSVAGDPATTGVLEVCFHAKRPMSQPRCGEGYIACFTLRRAVAAIGGGRRMPDAYDEMSVPKKSRTSIGSGVEEQQRHRRKSPYNLAQRPMKSCMRADLARQASRETVAASALDSVAPGQEHSSNGDRACDIMAVRLWQKVGRLHSGLVKRVGHQP